MEDFKIILFLCNWNPHAAFLELQDRQADIPAEIKMVRIPCSGRISKALLFKPFEMGADGVALMGCRPGSCRYGSGTASALENTDDTCRILELMGLGRGRLRLGTFLPDESEAVLTFLQEFSADIRRMGKSPIVPPADRLPHMGTADDPAAIAAAHDVLACQDCGKCTSACPLALAGKPFSPRALTAEVIAGRAETPAVRAGVDACLTCGVCTERCPSGVDFPGFIRSMRAYYHAHELTGAPAHGGFFQSVMRAMTAEKLAPRRFRELPPDIRTRPDSPVLFFGGCAPYFDIFFRKFLGVNTGRIISDGLRLLNFFDIEPALMESERCCGHDLLWSGDRDNFLRLARRNAAAIEESGARELITTCPECWHTLGHEYARAGVALPVTVTHLHAFLAREIGKGAVGFKPLEEPVVFQDACRQSRLGVAADLPRRLLAHIAGNNGASAACSAPISMCCGNSAWTGCDSFSKSMQVKHLHEAQRGGARLMLTACPKCQIHLRCAMEDAVRGDELKMELMDLTSAIAERIFWE